MKTVRIDATPETDADWTPVSIEVARWRNCSWPYIYIECKRSDSDRTERFSLMLTPKASAKLRKALEAGEAEIKETTA